MQQYKESRKSSSLCNFQEILNIARTTGYGGIITSVINHEFKREFIDQTLASKHLGFTRSPLILDAATWMNEGELKPAIVNLHLKNSFLQSFLT